MTDADRFHIPPLDEPVTRGTHECPPPPPLVNLEPLIVHFEREVSRLRDQLAVERGATSSAREALAACEERVRTLNASVAKWTRKADELCEDRDAVAAELERHKADRRDLIAQRDRMVADLQRDVALAANSSPMLTPGSTAAVIEAYRLLVGDSLEWGKRSGWHDEAKCDDANMEVATLRLIQWLDEHAPGGRP